MTDNSFSQLYAKVSVHEICPIPFQANERRQNRGVSFDFDTAPVTTDMALNPRINIRFMGIGNKIEQNNDVGLISPPVSAQSQQMMENDEYHLKHKAGSSANHKSTNSSLSPSLPRFSHAGAAYFYVYCFKW